MISNQGNSLFEYEVSKKTTFFFFVIHNKCIEKKTEQFRIFFRINFHKYFIGRMIFGKHACQQEEEQKGDISTVLMIQEQLFISELYKDIQDVISLILHYKTI